MPCFSHSSDDVLLIGGVPLSRVNLRSAVDKVLHAVDSGTTGYVCAVTVRTAWFAARDPAFAAILNGALLTLPSGMPLVAAARRRTASEVGPVTAPDFFDAILLRSEPQGLSHFFVGAETSNLERLAVCLVRKYPRIDVRGMEGWHGAEGTEGAVDALADKVNAAAPTFLWLSMDSPEQERFMARIQPKLDTTITVGVGNALAHVAGTWKRPPHWMRNLGLEWVFCLGQDAKRIPSFLRAAAWWFAKGRW